LLSIFSWYLKERSPAYDMDPDPARSSDSTTLKYVISLNLHFAINNQYPCNSPYFTAWIKKERENTKKNKIVE
jgi:hypothetical protein